MVAFPAQIASVRGACPDPTVLGTFSEGHDVPRMAYYTDDLSLLKNANVWNILFDGIPIVYQGQEQRFRGNTDPYNREAVWLSEYSTDATLYVLIGFLNSIHISDESDVEFRRSVIKADSDYISTLSDVIYSDYETAVLMKKDVMMVLTNSGAHGEQYTVTIPMTGTPYGNGSATEFTDIIACGKVKVASTGHFVTTISNGLPQVALPNHVLSSD